MSAPLTNGQKAYLAMLSERAFNWTAALARGQGREVADDSRVREQWRHEQVAAACGKAGLRCCSQDDYKLVEGHLLKLLGEDGRALKAFVRGATNAQRVAEYKVVEACKEFGFGLGYADAICRAQNGGAGLQDVDTRSLWRLVYTVRNRGLARKKAARGEMMGEAA